MNWQYISVSFALCTRSKTHLNIYFVWVIFVLILSGLHCCQQNDSSVDDFLSYNKLSEINWCLINAKAFDTNIKRK